MLHCMALLNSGMAQEDQSPTEERLAVGGRITDGENKLPGCRIVAYRENERLDTITTGKTGKFELFLRLNETYSLEFSMPGFVSKRIVIDTHAKIPAEQLLTVPLFMDISMLAEGKYEGVDTDVLDFPFAVVRYDKGAGAFVQDQEYTMGMQRANGALLLMAARSVKQGK